VKGCDTVKTPAMFLDRMELCGNSDLYIDRCRRLLECSDMLMLLELGGSRVAVWGHGLSASDYSSGGLHISGEIRAIEFDGGL
jgi:hypothetical protein